MMMRRMFAAGTLLVLSMSPCASGAGDGPNPSALAASQLLSTAGSTAHGDLRLRINPDALITLQEQPGPITLTLPLNPNETISLRMERFEVVASDTRILRGDRAGSAPMPTPQVVLLRGEIIGETASRAFIALDLAGGGSGSVTRGTGAQYHIATDHADGQPIGLIVHEGAGALPEFPQFCVAVPSPDMVGGGVDSLSSTARGPRVLNIAVEGDRSYTQLFSSGAAAQSYIIQVLGAVSDIYMRDLDFKLILRFSRIWPDGGEPFGADDLGGFRAYWVNNEDRTGINLVHLFSGRRDLSYGGVAYLANACSDFAFGISGFLLGNFPWQAPTSHLGNWDVVVVAHEMGHNLSTPHTHDYFPPIDQCTSSVEQRGTIMSYCHTNAGGLLNTNVSMHTRVAGFIAASNTPGTCLWHDCNSNGVSDAIDIQFGTAFDVNHNGIPDACEDRNENGVIDTTDIAAGAPDVNSNGIPDSVEPDCNGNHVPDAWEITQQTVSDLNGNGVPDGCEPDCDDNGQADFQDIFLGVHDDVDRNGVPDVCQDCNSNLVPDWIDVDREFNIFIGQTGSSVREYHAASGVFLRELGDASMSGAFDLTFGPDRQLYVTSFNGNRVVRVEVDSGTAATFVAAGAGGLSNPTSLTFGPDGNLYVASQANSNILKFNGATGAFIGVFVPGGSGSLFTPWDIVFGPDGNLFVITEQNGILEFNGSTGAFVGTFVSPLVGGLNDPRGMVFLANGHLLVTNYGGDYITEYDSTGNLIGQFNDIFPLTRPWGIALGPNGNVYAARASADIRIVEYDPSTGGYVRSFIRGDGGLVAPTAIAFRPASPDDLNTNAVPDECETAFCPPDIAPATTDGVVNAGDLLAVIDSWGVCPFPCPTYCRADVTRNCVVDVNDLLAVINAWGPCN